MTRLRAEDPITEAVAFLTAPGRAERALATHYRAADGHCAGCWVTRPKWPCLTATLAQKATALRELTQ